MHVFCIAYKGEREKREHSARKEEGRLIFPLEGCYLIFWPLVDVVRITEYSFTGGAIGK